MHTIQQLERVGIRVLLGGMIVLIGVSALPSHAAAQTERVRERLYVDPERGRDEHSGSRQRPVRTISGAIAKLPDPLTRSVTIELPAGRLMAFARGGGDERHG